jgi:hypothetical protein
VNKTSFVWVLVMSLGAAPLWASVTVAHYMAARKAGGRDWAEVNIYLNGFSNGLSFANVYNIGAHVPPLFCPPDNLRLNDDNTFDIVVATIKREARKPGDEGFVEGLLLRGMQFTFPCKQ